MKKFKRVIKILIIVVLSVVLLYLVLLNNTVDRFLTDLFIGKTETGHESDKVLYFGNISRDGDKCFFEVEDQKLYVIKEGVRYDVTPQEMNINVLLSAYESTQSLTQSLQQFENCRVSKDGNKVFFILRYNDIPTLYSYDFLQNATTEIDSRIDSFIYTDDEGGTLVYATGYARANSIYVYKAGEKIQIGVNAFGGYISKYDSVFMLGDKGLLSYYHIPTDKTTIIREEGVDVMHLPGIEAYDYDKMYQTPTVYYEIDKKCYIYNKDTSTELEGSYKEVAPFGIYAAAGQGQFYLYYEKSNKLVFSDNGYQTPVASSLGKIYKVFGYDQEREEFVLANGKGIYLFNTSDSTMLYKFDSIYKNNEAVIDAHLDVETGDFRNFFISSLDGASFIWNRKNPSSWMNRLSSYLYDVTYVGVQDDSGKISVNSRKLALPESRQAEDVILFSEDLYVIYTSKNTDGSIRSFSIISPEGEVANKDIFSSAMDSRGTRGMEIYMLDSDVYIAVYTTDNKCMLYKLNGSRAELEKSDEFSVYVSFGEIITC